MKTKKILIISLISIFLLQFNSNCFSQSDEKKEKKALSLFVGMDFRVTPIYINSEDIFFTNNHVFYDEHLHLAGARLTYGLQLNHAKWNLGIRYSQSLRYGHVYYKRNVKDTSNIYAVTYNDNVQRILIDHHFEFYKKFNLKKFDLKCLLGYSWMNRGSEYYYTKYLGNNVFVPKCSDFRYSGINIGVIASIQNWDVGLNFYYIGPGEHRFIQPQQSIIIPEIKLYYNFCLK